MRARFLEYAKTELPHLRMFLAEDAEKDYVTHDDPDFHNVAEFEELIGDVSDCILIFPESPGSFAELGYFSQSESIRKKVIVAHDASLQSEDSFISRGPVALFDKHSNFKPAIQISYLDPDFDAIKKRLEKRLTGKKRKRFDYVSYGDLKFREKLFAVLEIVRLLNPITFEALIYAFKSVFEHANEGDIKHQLSILIGAGLVERVGGDLQYFSTIGGVRTFMEFDETEDAKIRLEIVGLYNQIAPDLAKVIEGRAR